MAEISGRKWKAVEGCSYEGNITSCFPLKCLIPFMNLTVSEAFVKRRIT
jgi:hypothetical protein